MYLAATHPVFSGLAIKSLSKAGFKEVVVTNSIPVSPEKRFKGIKVLNIAEFLVRILKNIIESKSVSMLHEE